MRSYGMRPRPCKICGLPVIHQPFMKGGTDPISWMHHDVLARLLARCLMLGVPLTHVARPVELF